MKIEFLHNEVIEFLKFYDLFCLKIENRAQDLFELGEIDTLSLELAIKQKFNNELATNFIHSNIIRNDYLEFLVKKITGNEISIIDHDDETISGVSCPCCAYTVFENGEDACFEICPICLWQYGPIDKDGYSSINHSKINEYRNIFENKKNINDIKFLMFRKATS